MYALQDRRPPSPKPARFPFSRQVFAKTPNNRFFDGAPCRVRRRHSEQDPHPLGRRSHLDPLGAHAALVHPAQVRRHARLDLWRVGSEPRCGGEGSFAHGGRGGDAEWTVEVGEGGRRRAPSCRRGREDGRREAEVEQPREGQGGRSAATGRSGCCCCRLTGGRGGFGSNGDARKRSDCAIASSSSNDEDDVTTAPVCRRSTAAFIIFSSTDNSKFDLSVISSTTAADPRPRLQQRRAFLQTKLVTISEWSTRGGQATRAGGRTGARYPCRGAREPQRSD